ncbi:hypothetical protein D3C76_1128810 [compost metagenome]
MMRNRSFLSGLGIGLIMGAVLLQLMNVGTQQAAQMNNLSEVTLTKEQIEEKAKSLDLKVVESSEELLTAEEWKQKKIDESSKMQGNPVESPDQSESVVEPTEPTNPAEPTEKSSKTTSEVQVPNKPSASISTTTKVEQPLVKVSYKIEKGSSLTDVAEGLKRVNVI